MVIAECKNILLAMDMRCIPMVSWQVERMHRVWIHRGCRPINLYVIHQVHTTLKQSLCKHSDGILVADGGSHDVLHIRHSLRTSVGSEEYFVQDHRHIRMESVHGSADLLLVRLKVGVEMLRRVSSMKETHMQLNTTRNISIISA